MIVFLACFLRWQGRQYKYICAEYDENIKKGPVNSMDVRCSSGGDDGFRERIMEWEEQVLCSHRT